MKSSSYMLKRKNKIKSGKFTASNITMVLVWLVLSVFVVSMIIPLVWTFYSSFKNEIEYTLDVIGLPTKWRFSNYVTLWKELNVEVLIDFKVVRFGPIAMISYSLIIALSNTIKGLIGNLQVAYILAKFKSKFTNFLWTYMIVMMFIPLGPSLVITLKFYKWIGLYDNLLFFSLWGWGCFGGNTLLLYGAFKGVPDAYGEAAKIDGAGPITIFARIYVPQVFGMVATLFVLAIMSCWSNYMDTVLFLPSFPTLGYGLFYFRESAAMKGIGQPIVLAGCFTMAMLSMIIYLSTQNLILTKMSVGTLKQ